MNRLLLLLTLVPLLAFAADPAPKPVDTLDELKGLAEQAPVAAIDLVLPAGKQEIKKILWDHFANKPEEKQFGCVTGREWKAKWDFLVEALVAKAQKSGLNDKGLRTCLIGLNRGSAVPYESMEEQYPSDLEFGQLPAPKEATPTEKGQTSDVPSQLPLHQATPPENPPSADITPPLDNQYDGNYDATIPVGVYYAHHPGGACWIIVGKWEMAHPESRLGHIRVWAIDDSTQEIIGFTSCD